MLVPCLLSFSRIVLGPVVWFFIVQQNWWLACLVCMVAGVTDFLDGYVARLFGQESEFGAVLDPVADKLFLWFLFVATNVIGVTPLWFVVGVTIKELMLIVGGYCALLFYPQFRIRPTWSAKVLTATQFVFFSGAFVWFMVGYTVQTPIKTSVFILFFLWHIYVAWIYGRQVFSYVE